jgi:hypothetical protein
MQTVGAECFGADRLHHVCINGWGLAGLSALRPVKAARTCSIIAAPAPSVLSPTRFGGVVGVRPGGFAAHCAFEPRPHDILLIGGVLAAALTNYRKK